MGKEADEEDAHVVTGTFLVNFEPTFVLFDSEATHSFISSEHFRTLKLEVFDEIKDLVDIPSGDSIPSNRVYKDVSVKIGEVVFITNLIEFVLRGFEVILGMDWLGKYKAFIDCHQKKVTLSGPEGVKVSYKGFVVKPKIKLISTITLKSCLRKGGQLILCHVRDTRKDVQRAASVPIVQDFRVVFPDEIPGLSPQRDIDFGIDLKPRAGPISKAPYRMGPEELEEFKKQLEELLDKGKANVVTDAVSRKSVHALCIAMLRVRLHEEVEKMGFSMIKKGHIFGDLTIEPELYAEIREKQAGDS
ncbi:uncharacterized protein LOC141618283 [Silene latifolia]|uniref:uncharacterized protein LOC141618283 n=1 Tax=Silene latifolia TaxID=37657 RepID=UPI003D77D158